MPTWAFHDMRKTGWTGVTNSTAEDVPPFALMKPAGAVDEFGCLPVAKPDEDSEQGLFVNGPTTIPAGQRGAGTLDAEVILGYDGSDPAQGGTLGSVAGQWRAAAGGTGFKAITAGADGVCNAVRASTADVLGGVDNGNYGLAGGGPLYYHLTPTQLTNNRYVIIWASPTDTDDQGNTFTEPGPQLYIPANSGQVLVFGRIACQLSYGTDLASAFASGTVFNVSAEPLLISVDEDGNPIEWTDSDGRVSGTFPTDPPGGSNDGRLTEDLGPAVRAYKYTGSLNVFGDLVASGGWSGEVGGPIKSFFVGDQPLRLAWAVRVFGSCSASGLSSSGHAFTLAVPVGNEGMGSSHGHHMLAAIPVHLTSYPLPP